MDMDMDMGSESSENTTVTTTTACINSSNSSSSDIPNHHDSPCTHHVQLVNVVSPCAACKILRRRCADKCVLAPYFPPTDPLKFTTAHRVFGASNIIKFLQELPESQRADAVSSMVYEANARLRDPVYGCAGAICHLQKQVNELQEQLAKAQAQVVNMQCQQTNLLTNLLCMEIMPAPISHDNQYHLINSPSPPNSSNIQQHYSSNNFHDMNINLNNPINQNIIFQPNPASCFDIDMNNYLNLSSFWAEAEPLWT